MNRRKKFAGKDYLMVKIPSWLPPIDDVANKSGLNPDRLRIILHQCFLCWLASEKFKNKKKAHFISNGFFPVNSAILRQVGTDLYFRYMAQLLEHGILEKKNNNEGGKNYMVGVHSQLYRWRQPDDYQGSVRFRDEKVTEYKVIKAVLRTRDRYKLEDTVTPGKKKLLPIHEILRGFVYDATIDLEVAAAIERKYNPDFATDVYAELDMLHLAAICLGDTGFVSTDFFGERLHSHFTTLPKRFRPAIRFKGYDDTPLVCIDFKCSQPFFSATLAAGKIFDDLLPEFHSMRKLIEELAEQPDYRQYRYLCETGKFNNFLGAMRGIDPAIAKVEFFKAVIYAKRKIGPDDIAMRNEFKRFFPGVYKFFVAAKRLTENDLPDLKDIIKEPQGKYRNSSNSHKILPCMMQRAEARVMYQCIAPRMISKGLTPFLSIHDALLVVPEHVEASIEAINATFKELGVTPPTLTIKELAVE